MTHAARDGLNLALPFGNDQSWFTRKIEEHLAQRLPPEGQVPSEIHRAMRYAVLAGGKRLRSRLVLLAAEAASQSALADAETQLVHDTAAAIEFLHAASLVHDDMPCFDNAPFRRGKPTVHVLFGESMAVLTGDALLTLAFEVLTLVPPELAIRALRIQQLLARAVGTREGMIGGQSLEEDWKNYLSSEINPPLPMESEPRRQSRVIARYHQMKTGALFRAAAEAGAIAVGASDTASWAQVGLSVGLFFQMLDDLLDVTASAQQVGKPVGQDDTLGRPNTTLVLGINEAQADILALLASIRLQVSELAANSPSLFRFIDELQTYCQYQPGW